MWPKPQDGVFALSSLHGGGFGHVYPTRRSRAQDSHDGVGLQLCADLYSLRSKFQKLAQLANVSILRRPAFADYPRPPRFAE
jgi:hypothetical protein